MNLYEKKMFERYEQVECYSRSEYGRRIALTRKVMEEADVNLLIIFAPYKEAHDQWLTGKRYLEYLIVPEEGKLTGVLTDRLARDAGGGPPEYGKYLIQKEIRPVHDMVDFVDRVSFDELADALKKQGSERVGVVNPGALEAKFYDCLTEKLGRVQLVDITLPLSLVKNVKSEEEKQAIAQANRVHEKVMKAVPYILRQGKTDREITNELTYMMCTLGSGINLIHTFMINYGKQDAPAYEMGFAPHPGYVFQKGDRGMVLLETNGPGGHTTAVGRFFTLGEPTKGFADVIDMTIRTQRYATSLLKPGNTLAQIAKETRRFVEENGYETNDQCFMHGLGGFFYEQCGINDISENSPLAADMFLHAHPVIKRRFPGEEKIDHQFLLDAFYVSPEGGIRTNDVQQKLFVIE